MPNSQGIKKENIPLGPFFLPLFPKILTRFDNKLVNIEEEKQQEASR